MTDRCNPWSGSRDAWVEVDLDAVAHNVRTIRASLEPGCRFMAVLKADAYGHGDVACARAALAAGADYLGVATVAEAIRLRKGGIAAPLLVLSEPPCSTAETLIVHRIQPSIASRKFATCYADAALALGVDAPYHLAVNTGMNRIGVDAASVVDFARTLDGMGSLRREGTFTHFATADEDERTALDRQQRCFEACIASLHARGLPTGMVHAANSPATLCHPRLRYDMVRVGLSLFGYHPCEASRELFDLRQAMSVHARITSARRVAAGSGVSYGFRYTCPEDETVCTIPVGYGDGLRRGLSGRVRFDCGGAAARQVGNICMDQCMFVAPDRELHVGDEVVVAGNGEDAASWIEDMATALGTIPHEIAIGFSLRLERRYAPAAR